MRTPTSVDRCPQCSHLRGGSLAFPLLAPAISLKVIIELIILFAFRGHVLEFYNLKASKLGSEVANPYVISRVY